jgi:FkbM family methyltransferase
MNDNPVQINQNYQEVLEKLSDERVLKEIRQVFQRLSNLGYHPQVIFDIGASNSGWSCYIKKVLPLAEFYLFEPLIDYCSEYREFIEKTLVMYPSFHLHKIALGEKSGDTTINVFADSVVSSTALDMTSTGIKTIPVPVPMFTLDEAITSLNLPIPQVIKIDTQGSELSILKGAQKTLASVDILVLECWLYRGYGPDTPLLTEIADWLLPFNFRLWDVVEPYRNEQGVLATLDCVFVNTKSGITPDWHYA